MSNCDLIRSNYNHGLEPASFYSLVYTIHQHSLLDTYTRINLLQDVTNPYLQHYGRDNETTPARGFEIFQ